MRPLLPLLVFLLILSSVSFATWANSSYAFRSCIISNITSNQTLLPLVDLNESKTNGNDIRVVWENSTTELSFWRAGFTNIGTTYLWTSANASGSIWVNTTAIQGTDRTNAQLCIYYNATGVLDNSNGSKVFFYWDDFNATWVNRTGVGYGSTPTVCSLGSDEWDCQGKAGVDGGWAFSNQPIPKTNIIFECLMKANPGGNWNGFGVANKTHSTTFPYERMEGEWLLDGRTGNLINATYTTSDLGTYTANVWYDTIVNISSVGITTTTSLGAYSSATTPLASSSPVVGLTCAGSTTNYCAWDNCTVREQTTAPTFGSWGAEETQPSGASNCTVAVSLSSPTDETSSTASSQTLTANATLNVGCTNATVLFYLDGVNTVNSSLLTINGTTSTTAQSISLGAHSWYAFIIGDENTTNNQTINATSSTWDLYRPQTPSLSDGFFGWDSETIPAESTINTSLTTYGYTLVGLHLNYSDFDTNWTLVKNRINYSYIEHNIPTFFTIYFTSANWSVYNTECEKINANFTDLKSYPYSDGIAFVVIEINTSATEGNQTLFVNKISECIMNATANRFNIYSEYKNASLDTDFVSNYSFNKITDDGNLTTYIETEKGFIRNSSSITRIYSGENSAFKSTSSSYYNKIILNLRGIPTGVAFADDANVGEISNGDVIIYNNGSTTTNVSVDLTSKYPNDGWDKQTYALYANITNAGNIDVEVQGYNATMLFIDNFTRIEMYSDSLSTLRKNVATTEYEQDYFSGGTADGSYQSKETTDIRGEAWDGSYIKSNLFHTYELLPYTKVVNFTDYDYIVIAKGSNTPAIVTASIGATNLNKTFGYMSVANYDNSSESNCSAINAWETAKKIEILDWKVNYSIGGVFIDGFDIGAYYYSACFEARIKRLMDYGHSLNLKLAANTYTVYQNVSHYGDYVMRESCISRWDGVNASAPIYYYENMTLMEANANYLNSINKPVWCMAFGDVDDYDKLAYDYAGFAVLYGTEGNAFRYAQPDFQSQREVRVADYGTQLSSMVKANATNWYRVYSNGIVHFDPTRTVPFVNGKYYWFDNGETINAITVSAFFQVTGFENCGSGHNQYIVLNWTDATKQEVDECTDVGAVSWAGGTVTKTFNATIDYQPSGHYYIWIYPKDRANTTGMNVWNRANTETGVHSWYNDTSNGAPVSWSEYGRSGVTGNNQTVNWDFNLTINRSYSTAIDTGITTITASNAYHITTTKEGYNITIVSAKTYDIPILVYEQQLATDSLYFIRYNVTGLGYTNGNADCIGEIPTLTYTLADGGLHGACVLASGATYYVRIEAPTSSNKYYEIESGYAPNVVNLINVNGYSVNSSFYSLTGLLNVSYNVTDNDSATTNCTVLINGTNYGQNTSTLNNTNTLITTSPSLANGSYVFIVSCNDGTFTVNSSSLTMNISRYGPTLVNITQIDGELNGSIITDTTPNVEFYVQDPDNTTLECTLWVDGATHGTNSTVANNTLTNITPDFTLLYGTEYHFVIKCSDGLILLASEEWVENTTTPTIGWENPTPTDSVNNFTYGIKFNCSSDVPITDDSYIEIDGANKSCIMGTNNLTCSYSLPYSEHVFNNSYDAICYMNFSGTYYNGSNRTFNYYGCGYVNSNANLLSNLDGSGITCLTMNASGITIDCNSYWIDGNDAAATYGIYSYLVENNTIQECHITDFTNGIRIKESDYNTINNNTLSSNTYGIYVWNSTLNNVTNNVAFGDTTYGITTATDSDFIKIENNLVYSTGTGIYVQGSFNNVTNNTAYGSTTGIDIESSANVSLNVIFNNANYGLSVRGTTSTIFNNTAYNNTLAGLMAGANDIVYANNTIYNNVDYQLVSNNDNCYFYNNNFTAYGIQGVANNVGINNFWNTTNVLITNIIGGSNIGGNYWSNYNGWDTNGDGIGNTATYIVSVGEIDYLPLTNNNNYGPSGINITHIDSQLNASTITDQTPNVEFIFHDADNTTLNCTVYVNGVASGWNSTTNYTSTNITINQTLPYGVTYNFTVNCTDVISTNVSLQWQETYAGIPNTPNVSISADRTPIYAPTNLTCNATIYDAIGAGINVTFFYYENGTIIDAYNATYLNQHSGWTINDTVLYSEGLHFWTNYSCSAYTSNIVGTSGTGNSTNLTIGYVIPTINITSIDSQANNTSLNDSTPTVEYNITNTVNSVSTGELFINGTSYGINTTSLNNTLNNITASPSLASGNYSFVIESCDGAYCINSSAWLMEINGTPIVVTIIIPIEDYIYNGTTTSINYTAFSALGVDYCWYSLNGGTNTTIPLCNNFTAILAEGPNNITIWANDTANNIGSDSVSNFLYINFSYVGPLNNSYYFNNSTNVTFYVNGSNSTYLCSYYVDGILNNTVIYTTNGTHIYTINGTTLGPTIVSMNCSTTGTNLSVGNYTFYYFPQLINATPHTSTWGDGIPVPFEAEYYNPYGIDMPLLITLEGHTFNPDSCVDTANNCTYNHAFVAGVYPYHFEIIDNASVTVSSLTYIITVEGIDMGEGGGGGAGIGEEDGVGANETEEVSEEESIEIELPALPIASIDGITSFGNTVAITVEKILTGMEEKQLCCPVFGFGAIIIIGYLWFARRRKKD